MTCEDKASYDSTSPCKFTTLTDYRADFWELLSAANILDPVSSDVIVDGPGKGENSQKCALYLFCIAYRVAS